MNAIDDDWRPFGLASLIRDETTGKWRFRRKKIISTSICAVAYCRRKRRADKKSRLCHTCESREYRANHPIRAAYYNLRSHAKRRGIPVTITFDQFEAFVLSTGYIHKKGNRLRSHLNIDRIDNTKGYSVDNIQVLTLYENGCKAWYTDKRGDDYPF